MKSAPLGSDYPHVVEYGLASISGRNAYSASKSALLGLARASALDLGAYNITVNCIARVQSPRT